MKDDDESDDPYDISGNQKKKGKTMYTITEGMENDENTET